MSYVSALESSLVCASRGEDGAVAGQPQDTFHALVEWRWETEGFLLGHDVENVLEAPGTFFVFLPQDLGLWPWPPWSWPWPCSGSGTNKFFSWRRNFFLLPNSEVRKKSKFWPIFFFIFFL